MHLTHSHRLFITRTHHNFLKIENRLVVQNLRLVVEPTVFRSYHTASFAPVSVEWWRPLPSATVLPTKHNKAYSDIIRSVCTTPIWEFVCGASLRRTCHSSKAHNSQCSHQSALACSTVKLPLTLLCLTLLNY